MIPTPRDSTIRQRTCSWDTSIAAIGIAESYCWGSPKPAEFGDAGQNWESVGWRGRVRYTTLRNRVRPKDHIAILRPLLTEPAPPRPNREYLTEVSQPFAEVLAGLIGAEARPLVSATAIAPVVAARRTTTGDDLDV